jgi:hypothetical protein
VSYASCVPSFNPWAYVYWVQHVLGDGRKASQWFVFEITSFLARNMSICAWRRPIPRSPSPHFINALPGASPGEPFDTISSAMLDFQC